MTVEELKQKIDKGVFHTLLIMQTTPGDRNRRRLELSRDVNDLIAAARAEGAEFMKARILEQSYLKDVFSNPLVTLPADFYIVPASVLSPAPKEEK